MNEKEIVIVGAGIIGLSSAIAFHEAGFRVLIIDSGSIEPLNLSKWDKRVYAINQSSQLLLTKLKVWQLCPQERLAPYKHMHVWDGRTNTQINFNGAMIGDPALGVIVEEKVLKNALLQRIAELGIIIRANTALKRIEPLNALIKVTDTEQAREASLLIGADGANSTVRRLLNVPITSWSYHQQALVTTVETQKPHQDTAWQIFFEDGVLAFLPLPDPNHCSIVWSANTKRAQYLYNLPLDEFNNELTKVFKQHLGSCKALNTCQMFPLTMRHVQQYSGNNWALLGDAAHTIHPMAGLGLNIGLADLKTLLELCAQNKLPPWSPKILKIYQRQRKSALWRMILFLEALKLSFSNPLLPIVKLRSFGLNLCNNLPIVKQWLVKQAQDI